MRIKCPYCDASYEVGEDFRGDNVLCTVCRRDFVAYEDPNPEPVLDSDAVYEAVNPVVVGDAIPLKRCPLCASAVALSAKTCPYCGHSFATISVKCVLEVLRFTMLALILLCALLVLSGQLSRQRYMHELEEQAIALEEESDALKELAARVPEGDLRVVDQLQKIEQDLRVNAIRRGVR